MRRRRSNMDYVTICGVRISKHMAKALLDIQKGHNPYWPSHTVRALHARKLVYPEADLNGRFMLSDLGVEVAAQLAAATDKMSL